LNISNAYKSSKYFKNLYHFGDNFKYLRIFVLVTATKKNKINNGKNWLVYYLLDGDNKYEYQRLL